MGLSEPAGERAGADDDNDDVMMSVMCFVGYRVIVYRWNLASSGIFHRSRQYMH